MKEEKKRGGKITLGGESDFVVNFEWSLSVDHGDTDRVEYVYIFHFISLQESIYLLLLNNFPNKLFLYCPSFGVAFVFSLFIF